MPTEKPEFPYTLQQSLDIVVTHLKAGGKRSYVVEHGCSYRGNDGAKCFFGLLLPDEVAEKYEGCTSTIVLLEHYAPTTSKVLSAFSRLQGVHDHRRHWTNGGFNEEGWNALKQWAKDNNLTMPEV